MPGQTTRNWITGVLLALPLVGLTAWVGVGLVRRPAPAPAAAAPTARPAPAASPGPAALPPSDADLPPDRMAERINGAAGYYIGLGCRRLLYWRIEQPGADLELFLFDGPEGARTAFERDAGPGRTEGPGDEAQVTDQSILFRRGTGYVRLFADPGGRAAAFLERARALDAALAAGSLR